MAEEQPGFFRRVGNRLGDFFTSAGQTLGDAFGVTAAGERGYLEGMQERSQSEAAMALARQRREESRRLETERFARENLGYSLSRALDVPLYDAEPLADIMRAGYADFGGITGGRGDIQQQGFRSTIADPSLGEEFRVAAMEALSPSSAIAARRSGGEPLEIVIDPDTGEAVYVPRSSAAGQRPGSRPSAASSSAGGLRAADTNAIYRQATGLFGGTWDPISGRVVGLSRDQAEQVQRIASRASQIYAQGGIDHATAVDIALQEMRAGGIPPPAVGGPVDPVGVPDEYEGLTATGPNGEKVIWRNGQWVPLQ